MPPHCDSIDGPVAVAAAQALESNDVSLVLPYVHREGEVEVAQAFDLAVRARSLGRDSREVANRWFFETVVRIHRAGEGAPYTGLKPAGLDVGPVIPLAEDVIATGDPTPLADFLITTVRDQVQRHFNSMKEAQVTATREGTIEAQREHVEAMLGLEVWAHSVYKATVDVTPHS
jgi:hypothetical protein